MIASSGSFTEKSYAADLIQRRQRSEFLCKLPDLSSHAYLVSFSPNLHIHMIFSTGTASIKGTFYTAIKVCISSCLLKMMIYTAFECTQSHRD